MTEVPRRPVRFPESIGVLHPTFESWGGAEWFLHGILGEMTARLGTDIVLYTHRWNPPVGETVSYRVVEHRQGGARTGPWVWERLARRFAGLWSQHDVLLVQNYPATEWIARVPPSVVLPPTVWYCQEPPRTLYDAQAEEGERVSRWSDLPSRLMRGIAFYRTGAVRWLVDAAHLALVERQRGDSRMELLRDDDRRAVRNMTRVVANSQFTARRVADIYNREAAVVYPLLPDCDRVAAGGAPPDKSSTVLWVGRLTQAKRPHLMLAAWRRAAEVTPSLSEYQLVMVGDGPLRAAVADELRKSRLGGTILWHRNIARQQLLRLYAEALVTVHLSVGEPFGLVPLESILSGTPVLAACRGGDAEIVVDGQTGFCLDPGVEELAAWLAKVPARHAELEAMGPPAAALARSRFSFARTYDGLCEILVELGRSQA